MNNFNKPVADDDNDSVLFERLQQNAIEHYPNPSRRGCPPPETLAKFVESPAEVSVGDLNNLHIFHCAECTMDLRTLREAREKRLAEPAAPGGTKSRKRWMAIAAVLDTNIRIPLWRRLRAYGASAKREKETSFVLSDASAERGPEDGFILLRSRLTLRIVLTRSHPDGAYEIILSKQRAMEPAAIRLVAEAEDLSDHHQLTVKLDLRTLPAGEYWIGVKSKTHGAPWFTCVVLQ